MTDTSPARELMTEFNRACRTGSLFGGKLAYTADGPGEWFPANSQIERAGVYSLAVEYGRRITLAQAEAFIAEAQRLARSDDEQD